MKYLFINSVAGVGSTGRIVAAQCRELMAQGQQCKLAYGRDKANCGDIDTIQIGSKMDYQIHGAMTRLLDLHGFGSKAATKRFLRQVEEYDPDVIWLHNLHGYYINIELLFAYLKKCGKEIRWTLHDCWAFTGHCAYFSAVQCVQWKSRCRRCVQKGQYPASRWKDNCQENFDRKRAAFTGVDHMTLITPSHWLANLVRQSFLGEYPIEVRYHTIDTNVFQPTPSDFRERYGLQGKKIVLGVANVWEDRKGLRDFLRLARMLDSRFQIVLVGLTEKQIAHLPDTVLGIPRTNRGEELAAIYTAADVFVNPSREETFGLTTVEAIACGTEAIVFQNTACEEIVGKYGGNAVPYDLDALAARIIYVTGGSAGLPSG